VLLSVGPNEFRLLTLDPVSGLKTERQLQPQTRFLSELKRDYLGPVGDQVQLHKTIQRLVFEVVENLDSQAAVLVDRVHSNSQNAALDARNAALAGPACYSSALIRDSKLHRKSCF
jgi:hypothetical protein